MIWIPIPFPISIQFTLSIVHTVEFFCLHSFMQQKAMSADVFHVTLQTALDSHLCVFNKPVKWVLSRHCICKMAIFL